MNHDELRLRSLKIILDNQEPGGAYLAGPNMPDYQFSWFRDGAYIAHALLVDGLRAGLEHGGSMAAQWESAGRFHDWAATVITERAAAIERGIRRAARGEPVPPEETINARYRADGSVGPDGWPEFQLDGPGIWLWALSQYVREVGVSPLPERWVEAIDLVARYLSAMWQTPCYDYWEEAGGDTHTSTLGAIYAGLAAADRLLGTDRYAATAGTIRRVVLARGLTPGGELAKSFGRDMVDANLISVAVPHGVFAPDDPLIRRTIARIERDLHPAHSGVHRHVEDVYYGGGAWVLLALWLAWYYAEAGDVDKARDLFDWAATQADEDGNLPEQVTTTLLAPDHYAPWVVIRGPIARPLLWTHAKYLIVSAALKAAREG